MDRDIRDLNKTFASSSTPEILQWICREWRTELAMISSFQLTGLVLIHMLKTLRSLPDLYFIDTGFHFPETLDFVAKIESLWKLKVVRVRAEKDPQASSKNGAPPLYESDPDSCCRIHKVEPFRRVKIESGRTRWISALRRDQSPTRSNHRLFMRDDDGHIRVHPMIHWTREQIWEYVIRHRLPYHPHYDRGYTSIGCFPPVCTRRNGSTEDERAGRWSGRNKKECGLHLLVRNDQSVTEDTMGMEVKDAG